MPNQIVTQDEAVQTEEPLVEHRDCDGCNTHLPTSELLFIREDNEYYCSECQPELDHCDRCESYSTDLNMRDVVCLDGTESTCQNCRSGMDTFRCDRCACTYNADEFESREVRGYGSICERCEEHLNINDCINCGDSFERGNLYETSDGLCCGDCRRSSDGAYIHNYSFKPKTRFIMSEAEKASNKKPELFFGLELEVEKSGSVQIDTIANKIQQKGILYFKNDGSLNHGFEIVSHPMSYDFIIEQKDKMFLNILNTLIESKYRSYDTSTCGMHIHLSKKAFGTWQLYRFIKFFMENKQFVTAISQRKLENLDRWAAIESEPDSSIIYKAKKKSGNSKRYVAINLQNEHTVELRIFRGTLNIHSFTKNIEFCYALFNFTRDVNDTSIEAFKKYINQSNEYSVLKKFIKTKNL